MKKNDQNSKILIAGLLCSFFTFLIWHWSENKIKYYTNQSNKGLIQIAQIKSKSNTVLRNHSGQLLWQDIDSGDSVYLGNSIQTEKKSSTEIILNDGEKIIIGPESLVRFTDVENKIELQLIDGKIEIKSPDLLTQQSMKLDTQKNSRLSIQTPRGRLDLNKSNIKLQTDKNNNSKFKIEVVSGNPEITTSTKKEILKSSPIHEKINVIDIGEDVQDTKIFLKPPTPTKPETPITPSTEIVEIQEKIDESNEITKPVIKPEPVPVKTEISTKPIKIPPTSITKSNEIKIERAPAKIQLKAPKIKSIKVKDVE